MCCAGKLEQVQLKSLPEVVGVVLEGQEHIGLAIAALAASKAARGQDDVLGEGDVQATVNLDASRPCVIGEVDVGAPAAQVVSAAVREQPAAQRA